MDQRQEMMDDAIDDVTGLEDEEEGDVVVQEVLDEIGVDLGQAVCLVHVCFGRGVWFCGGRLGLTVDFYRWERHLRAFRRMP